MAEISIPEAFLQAVRHHQAGHLPEAEAVYRVILARDPGHCGALHYLGVIAHHVGRNEVALRLIQQAAALAPKDAVIHSNLGEVYRHLARFEEAVACFRQALLLNPDFASAHNNLGIALYDLGRPDEAIACYRQALALRPDFGEAHNNIGLVHLERGQPDDALPWFERSLALSPGFPEAHFNLGRSLKDRGQLDEAMVSFQRALALRPDRADYHSNLILNLHYRSAHEPSAIASELRRWNERHARPLARFIQPHANDRSPDRRLRIGYVSHDFRRHSLAFFLLPLIEAHDRGRWQVTAYATNAKPDDVTARFRACTDSWCSLVGLSDEAAAQRIRDDRIDVLIDLSGHTGGNRLPIFACRPAPVQVSYLGYPGSTGLDTMDYRLTDPWADPPGTTVEFHSEQLVRLPDTAWCFTPLSGSPPVGALPFLRLGHITFGCFNNSAKISDDMLQLWARILQRVPNSRLLLKNFALGSPPLPERLNAFMAAQGIPADRLELLPIQPSPLDHLRCYDRIDFALDTFPYHGTTTTCEALWMGVPVLTLAGDRHASRVGVSLLTNVGLPEFVTTNSNAYVDAAVATAGDVPHLAAQRASLRERMQRSPLMDAPRFARAIESAYRTMWHRWCGQEVPAAVPTR
ncbi:MAG: tetratricopeptide repeat protein [Verrucomicrobia bacterium]|nr:tetratricopeptide repeat protein [Verrucomicrobiota bacterium]